MAAGTNYWQGLKSIITEAREEAREQRSRPPAACPCGEPLKPDGHGNLVCAFDGWQWPRDKDSAIR